MRIGNWDGNMFFHFINDRIKPRSGIERRRNVHLNFLNRNIKNATKMTQIIKQVCANAQAGQHILIMSNGGFGGLHQKLLAALHKTDIVS